MTRIGYLDGWRGAAILGVLLGHFLHVPGIKPARLGVELFFVLSGRLMAEILFVRQTALPTFFARRFARVYPAFAIFVLLVHLSGIFSVTWVEVLSCLTFTYNYLYTDFATSITFNHIWSLCVEEHMYLLLGLLAWFCRAKKRDPLPILIALALIMVAHGAVRYALGYSYYESYWRSDVRGASILAGAIAFLLVTRLNLLCRTPPLMPLGLGLLSIALNLGRVPDPIKYSLGTMCLAFCLVLLPSASGLMLRLLENTLLRWIGLISFSLYLWQQIFFEYGREHFGTLYAPLGIGLSMLAGLFGYFCLEKPTRPLTLKLISRFTPGSAPG
jgi:peptidoglycan/LPS O-acetylase OafA/YrhL